LPCWAKSWSAAARRAVFRGGIDPVQLYVSIAGLAYFYLSNSFTLSSIFGRDLLSPRRAASACRTCAT
jgi:hypothetical protein